jgi:hypothetical protein
LRISSTLIPWARHELKSSTPYAGDEWTIPVPSSAVA